ncbi:MAG: AAA family ATPase [Planctomycetota bacterium]|nr:AAA family ATPase [Planctomycetota bacterium]MDA1179695.1 AAA family ATPase [Planctomycetota bacterium]
MYESHWSLTCKPFESTFHESLYYPSESHQGALLKLRYVIEQQRGAALLSGAAGLGKTLLLGDLLRRLPTEYQPQVSVVYPRLPAPELLALVCAEITRQSSVDELPPHERLLRLTAFLAQNTEEGKHAILVLDEAHLLDSREHLEMVRLLLNLGRNGSPHLTIVLAGQPSLLTLVERMPALEERLAVKCLLRSLSADETAGYVQHRLRAARARQPIFTDAALDTVFEISQGTPRRINRICDLSMLIAYADERQEIDAEHVAAVADELIVVSPE